MNTGEKSDDTTPTAGSIPSREDVVPDANVPKEGPVAWLQVLGAFCVYLNTWGVLNSYGVFQTYYKLDFLSLQSTSTIGWIRSLQGVLFFAVSIIVGPMFDLGYFRSLTWVGTAFSVVGMFLLSISSQFYQMLLTQSVLVGIGEGCLFLPAPAVVAQHFNTHLGLAVSIASVGSAVVVVAVLFGVASGAFLGLPVASIARLSDNASKIGVLLVASTVVLAMIRIAKAGK
ncbi:hypothetical protein CIB48_g1714 [Xylaria polymorpha]|nr:hypothetical protein CIB48_g1714 [Xylaria polymorpha]